MAEGACQSAEMGIGNTSANRVTRHTCGPVNFLDHTGSAGLTRTAHEWSLDRERR